MKVVINKCYGGFGLSDEAIKRYFEIKEQPIWFETNPKYFFLTTIWLVPPEERLELKEGDSFNKLSDKQKIKYNEKYKEQTWYYGDIARDDPVLVRVVEELGDKANGSYAKLKVVDIPDDVEWQIEEYDGKEWVAETHTIWS